MFESPYRPIHVRDVTVSFAFLLFLLLSNRRKKGCHQEEKDKEKSDENITKKKDKGERDREEPNPCSFVRPDNLVCVCVCVYMCLHHHLLANQLEPPIGFTSHCVETINGASVQLVNCIFIRPINLPVVGDQGKQGISEKISNNEYDENGWWPHWKKSEMLHWSIGRKSLLGFEDKGILRTSTSKRNSWLEITLSILINLDSSRNPSIHLACWSLRARSMDPSSLPLRTLL